MPIIWQISCTANRFSCWQADHCLLDVFLVREGQAPAKPWLTVILDDYSRAMAGYFLTFDAPSALHTSLALRQAIWRKDDPRWHICGVPLVFYTDCGSDFLSEHLKQVGTDWARSRSRLGICGIFLVKPCSKIICPAIMRQMRRW